MSRRILVTAALVAVVVTLAAAGALVARAATTDPRAVQVTKGLDYLHARQQANGGFGSMAGTVWGVLAVAASGERVGDRSWTIGGTTPFTFMQSRSHETAASGYDVDNPVVYYAQAVMSYVAAGQPGRVFMAGTPRVDLLAKLYAYQDLSDGATKGSFSPSSSSREYQAVHTTVWAIAAMQSIGESGKERFGWAVSWLAEQQRADGGFPAQGGSGSNVEDTAMAIQALKLAGSTHVDPAVIPAARAYLKARQRSDGGFPYQSGGALSAAATSAAIQAIVALGEDPDGAAWTVGSTTPRRALGTLQRVSGAFNARPRTLSEPVPTTSWAMTAHREQAFTTFPRSRPATVKPFVFRPRFTAASPKHGASFTSTRSVLLRASYSDGTKGTGVDPGLCRVFVDGTNRSKAASIGRYGMRLQLRDLTNGVHSWELRVTDYAGNVTTLKRTFTVAVPLPTPAPTPAPTYYPAPITPSTSTPRPTPYPTATSTLYPSASASPLPYPTPTITGAVIPSASASPGPGSATGSGAGFVGGTLLAMLPIGGTLAYLAFERRARVLGQAGEGTILRGGGSAWERLRSTLARSTDLFKRAGS